MKKDEAAIHDMLNAGHLVLDFVKGVEKTAFLVGKPARQSCIN